MKHFQFFVLLLCGQPSFAGDRLPDITVPLGYPNTPALTQANLQQAIDSYQGGPNQRVIIRLNPQAGPVQIGSPANPGGIRIFGKVNLTILGGGAVFNGFRPVDPQDPHSSNTCEGTDIFTIQSSEQIRIENLITLQSDVGSCAGYVIKSSNEVVLKNLRHDSGITAVSAPIAYDPDGAPLDGESVSTGITIMDSVFSPSGYGVYFEGGKNILLSGNEIYGTHRYDCIKMTPILDLERVLITGNYLHDCAGDGIDISAVAYPASHATWNGQIGRGSLLGLDVKYNAIVANVMEGIQLKRNYDLPLPLVAPVPSPTPRILDAIDIEQNIIAKNQVVGVNVVVARGPGDAQAAGCVPRPRDLAHFDPSAIISHNFIYQNPARLDANAGCQAAIHVLDSCGVMISENWVALTGADVVDAPDICLGYGGDTTVTYEQFDTWIRANLFRDLPGLSVLKYPDKTGIDCPDYLCTNRVYFDVNQAEVVTEATALDQDGQDALDRIIGLMLGNSHLNSAQISAIVAQTLK